MHLSKTLNCNKGTVRRSASVNLKVLGVNTRIIVTKKGMRNVRRDEPLGGFWSRSDEYHWYMLERARDNYRKLSVKYHPDRNPKHHKRFVAINAAWKIVKTLYAKRNYVIE